MDPKSLIVSQGRLPIWRAVLASSCFLAGLYVVGNNIWSIYLFGFKEEVLAACAESLYSMGIFLSGGIVLGTRLTIRIEPHQNLLHTDFEIGPFVKTRTTIAPEIEYVSVFKNEKGVFETNLWYKGNRHYKLHVFNTKEDAFELAYPLASKLNLDILDATVKGNSHWIALSES